MDPGSDCSVHLIEMSGGSGGARGITDESSGSKIDYNSEVNTYSIQLGAGGLRNPSFTRKIHFLIVLSLLAVLSRERGIEQDDDSSEEE